MSFPALFHFGGDKGGCPESFKPTHHIFYSQRVIDVAPEAGVRYWAGAKEKSQELTSSGAIKKTRSAADAHGTSLSDEEGSEDEGDQEEKGAKKKKQKTSDGS